MFNVVFELNKDKTIIYSNNIVKKTLTFWVEQNITKEISYKTIHNIPCCEYKLVELPTHLYTYLYLPTHPKIATCTHILQHH